MRFILGSLLLMLLVSSLCPVHGILEIYNTNLKCQCKRTTADFTRFRLISRIDITHPGNGCPNVEIIVRLRNKVAICVDPASDLAKRVLNLWRKKKRNSWFHQLQLRHRKPDANIPAKDTCIPPYSCYGFSFVFCWTFSKKKSFPIHASMRIHGKITLWRLIGQIWTFFECSTLHTWNLHFIHQGGKFLWV